MRNVFHYSNASIIKFDSVENKQKLNQNEKRGNKTTDPKHDLRLGWIKEGSDSPFLRQKSEEVPKGCAKNSICA